MDPFLVEIDGADDDGARFPSPFDDEAPHPFAQRAAEIVQSDLARGSALRDGMSESLRRPGGGKMFGVLVVATGGARVGFLRAFSGMLAGDWEVPGYAPPLFDPAARAAIEIPGEVAVKSLFARARACEGAPELTSARFEHFASLARQRDEREAMIARHRTNRAARREARRVLDADYRGERAALVSAHHALDQASRADKAALRRLGAMHSARAAESAVRLASLEYRLAALIRLHAMASRRLMRAIHDCYSVQNARGETVPLPSLYAPGEPPSGAADCAAPKLLGLAYRRGWRPVALAEFWWGAPPAAGARVAGQYYRACRDKCGPLLPFMLQGVDVAPQRKFIPPRLVHVDLDVVHADARIVVIDKPAGLLSVPSSDGPAGDSALQRIRRRFPAASGPILLHRIDLDTSGLLVFTLDPVANAHLQKQFIKRIVKKRYIAWIDAELASDGGTIELPIRTDINDRPRQVYDPVAGRPATTDWLVLERRGGRTRVAFVPRTGRTHQLRVHAAHPLGLGAPIVGDRLYGRGGERLLLHAEAITLRHPANGDWVTYESPAPF